MQHGDAPGDRAHEIHVVLHHQKRVPARQGGQELRGALHHETELAVPTHGLAELFQDLHAAVSAAPAAERLKRASRPAIPRGRNKVTSTNRPPRANNQASGMTPVK